MNGAELSYRFNKIRVAVFRDCMSNPEDSFFIFEDVLTLTK